MLNEQRVILMTKLASYEEHEGKKSSSVGHYFRSDYIGLQLVKSVICATIAFVIMAALYIFYDFENFMVQVYNNQDLLAFGRRFLILYLCLAGGYAVVSYMIYSYRYNRARKSLKLYYSNLKRLANMYDK